MTTPTPPAALPTALPAASPAALPAASPTAPGAGFPPPPRSPSFLKPVLGLIAALGIMVIVVVTGTFIATVFMLSGMDLKQFQWPLAYSLANLTFAVFGAMAGGFTASRITRDHTLYTVYLLAVITAVSGLVPVLRGVAPVNGQPSWYSLGIAVLVPIGVLVGGILERRKSR